jgi:hypothetical protein
MRRHRPRGTIPKTYRHVPSGHTVGAATFAELEAAGFHGHPEALTRERPRESAPLSERVEADLTSVPLETPAGAVFIVLRNGGGSIVATWSEGRWWTPQESDRYSDALDAESEPKLPVGLSPT